MTSTDPAAILQTFVDAFRDDPESVRYTACVGVRIKGHGDWHINADGAGHVDLREGFPDRPIAFYSLARSTLLDIHDGRLNALTAMGKARSTDSAPVEVEFHRDFEPDRTFFDWFIPFTFDLFTRGQPKIIPFGSEHTRTVHGAEATVLYYARGLRTAWYRIERGQHINRGKQDQVNPFPSLFIFTRGRALARIGGCKVTLEAGQTVLVPAGVNHEFWNDLADPAELILIMFGEGA